MYDIRGLEELLQGMFPADIHMINTAYRYGKASWSNQSDITIPQRTLTGILNLVKSIREDHQKTLDDLIELEDRTGEKAKSLLEFEAEMNRCVDSGILSI